MQELIDKIDKSESGSKEVIKYWAKQLLEKEKKVIIEAYNYPNCIDGEQYYNETFKNDR